MMALRQNVHIGICNGAAMEKVIWEGQSTGVWGRVQWRKQRGLYSNRQR